MAGADTVTLGALRTFLQATSVAPLSIDVRVQYPDEALDTSKVLVLLELVDAQPRDWVGLAGPSTSTPGKVDKATQQLFVVRVESWGARAADALDVLSSIRQRLIRERNLLLKDAGLKYQDQGKTRTLPFDANHPGWNKCALWLSAYKDEAWTEDP